MGIALDLSPYSTHLTSSISDEDASDILFGSGSIQFPGSAAMTVGSDLSQHDINAGDFTIEGWAKFDGLPQPAQWGLAVIVGKAASFNQSFYVGVNGSSILSFSWSSDGTGSGITSIASSAAVGPSFFHFAVSRVGSTVRLFLNGVLQATSSISNFHNSSTPLLVGGIAVAGYDYFWNGNIRDLRITKGVGRYTATFTPPTDPLPVGAADPQFANVSLMTRLDKFFKPEVTKLADTGFRIFARQPAAPVWKFGSTPFFIQDRIDGGRGSIFGTVKEKATPTNLPLRRRVRLVHEFSGRIVAETWSDPVTGNYAFSNIDERQKYLVYSLDYENNYRAEIADNLTPTV